MRNTACLIPASDADFFKLPVSSWTPIGCNWVDEPSAALVAWGSGVDYSRYWVAGTPVLEAALLETEFLTLGTSCLSDTLSRGIRTTIRSGAFFQGRPPNVR
jgi:hypothetical protein